MIERDNEHEYQRAFDEGESAHRMNLGLGNNPYSPENEQRLYEAWVDGWSNQDNKS